MASLLGQVAVHGVGQICSVFGNWPIRLKNMWDLIGSTQLDCFSMFSDLALKSYLIYRNTNLTLNLAQERMTSGLTLASGLTAATLTIVVRSLYGQV
jgi:hypothetical protein